MFKTILLAYDGFEGSAAALRQAAGLAKLTNAELHLLGVVAVTISSAIGEGYGAGLFEMEHGLIEDALEQAVNDLGDNVSVHTAIRKGEPAMEIAKEAEAIGADLVVIGHSDKGLLSRWFEGSTGAALIRDLPCNLLVASQNQ